MEQERVAAYLKVACTAMNFDIGEVWCYRMDQEGHGNPLADQERCKSMRFVQLHTSPNYDRMRDKLLTPKAIANPEDLAEHRFSPAVCDAVRDGREMFWATTEAGEGLLGRSDLTLRTAVGLPVCSIGYDLCILVLFANEKLASSPNFAQMLGKLSQAAAGMMSGALPASISSPIATGLDGISTGVAGAQDASGGVLWQCPSHKAQPGSGQHAIVKAIRRNTAARNLCMKLITFGGGAGYKEAILYGGPKTAAAAAAAAGHQFSSGGSEFFLDEPCPTFYSSSSNQGRQSAGIEYDMDADDETESVGSSASQSWKSKEKVVSVGSKRPRSDSNVSAGSSSLSIGDLSKLTIPSGLGSGRMSPAGGVSPMASPRANSEVGASDLFDLSSDEMRKLLGPNGSPKSSAPNSVSGSVPGSPKHPSSGRQLEAGPSSSRPMGVADAAAASSAGVGYSYSASGSASAGGPMLPTNGKMPSGLADGDIVLGGPPAMARTSSDPRDLRMDDSMHSVSSERSCSSNLTTGEQDVPGWALRVPAGGWANGGAQAANGLDVSCTMSDLENLADLSDLDEQSMDGDTLRTLEVEGMEPAAKQPRSGRKRGHSPPRQQHGGKGEPSGARGRGGPENPLDKSLDSSLDKTMHGGASIQRQLVGGELDSMGGSSHGRGRMSSGEGEHDLGMDDSGMDSAVHGGQVAPHSHEQGMRDMAASRRKRFEEFMRGFLEMSIFEAADCWFSVPATTVADENGNVKTEEGMIKHAFSVVRSQNLQPWAAYSAEIAMPVGRGLPGLVIASGAPVWEKALHRRPSHEHPRAPGAKALGICTAFGVPSADLGFGYSGAVCFYATASLDQSPIMVSFVENVIRCLSEEAAAETAQAAGIATPSMDGSNSGNNIVRTLTAENLAALESTNHGRSRRLNASAMGGSVGSRSFSGMDSMPVGTMGGYTARQPVSSGPYDSAHAQPSVQFEPGPGHGGMYEQGPPPVGSNGPAGHDVLTASMIRAVSSTGPTGGQGGPMYDGSVQSGGFQGAPMDGMGVGVGVPMGGMGMGVPSGPSGPSSGGYHGPYQGHQHQQYHPQGQPVDPYPAGGPAYDGRGDGRVGVGGGGGGGGGSNGLWASAPPTPGLVWQGQNDESAAVEALLMAGAGSGGSQGPGSKRRTRGRSSAYSDYDMGIGEADVGFDAFAGGAAPAAASKAPVRGRDGRRTSAKRAKNNKGAAVSTEDVGDGDIDNKCCRMAGCTALPSKRSPYCAEHMGARQCHHQGCNKCAQGSTKFCIAHGGGRRCTHPGCTRGARDKFFCAAHGGGKRCSEDNCNKSAVGGSNLCTAHGGGRRCKIADCDKSAQSSTDFCVRHGGGRKCDVESCEKVARGRTSKCAAHGGGVRCKLEGCNKAAVGRQQLCRLHSGTSVPKKRQVKQAAVAALAASKDMKMDHGGFDASGNMMDMGQPYPPQAQPW